MKTIMADPAFLSAIQKISEPTEIVDPNGHSVAAIYPMSLSAVPRVDLDLVRKASRESVSSGDVTTDQLLGGLRSLVQP